MDGWQHAWWAAGVCAWCAHHQHADGPCGRMFQVARMETRSSLITPRSTLHTGPVRMWEAVCWRGCMTLGHGMPLSRTAMHAAAAASVCPYMVGPHTNMHACAHHGMAGLGRLIIDLCAEWVHAMAPCCHARACTVDIWCARAGAQAPATARCAAWDPC